MPFSTSSYPDYLDLKARNDVFDDAVAYSPMFGALNLGERSRLALGEIVTGNYFQMLGVGAAAGRTLLPGRRRAGRAARRDDFVSLLDARARREPRHRRAHAEAARRRLHDRRRRAARVRRHDAGRSRPSSGCRWPRTWRSSRSACTTSCRRPTGRRGSIGAASGGCSSRGGCKPGKTAAEAGANLDVLMARLDQSYPTTNKDRHVSVKAAGAVFFHPGARRPAAPDRARPDARRRPRAPDRVRERRQHAAGARVGPPEGDRHPAGDRRRARPARAPARHREPGAVDDRRRVRRRARLGAPARGRVDQPAGADSARRSTCGSTFACCSSRSARR